MGHTPGEWTTDTCAIKAKREDGTTFDLARVYWPEPGRDEEFTANANLIAAAPELLARCKAFVMAYDRFGTHPGDEADLDAVVQGTRDVIAKAEGKP